MATITGKTNTSVWTFKLEVTEGAVNVGANTSPVTVAAYIGRSSSGSYMYGASISCGVEVTDCPKQTITYKNANQVNVSAGGWLHIGSVTFQVPHKADGTKEVNISASFTNNVSPSSGSASGTMTLTTIPRASQPSCVTWPEHTQNVGEFGGPPISIHMNRKSDSFTHTVRYAYGDLSGVIARDVTTGVEWTVPLSFMNKIPNATSGSGTIFVDTYSGSNFVGTKSCGFTATVPASVKPTVTATLTDTTEGINATYGQPVAGLSKIKVTTSASQAYSSPIATTQITIDGATYAANTVTTGLLQNSGYSRVTVVVTDKRGRTGSWEYVMNVQPYDRPWVSMLAVHRTNGDWEENDQGDHVMVTFSAQVSPMNDKNLADYSLRYKKTTESNWQTIDLSEIDNNFNVNNYAVLFEADIASSYDVELTATDRHHSNSRSTSASTAFSLMDWHSSGTGIAFGKVAEHENTMDVALGFRLSGGIEPIEIQEGEDLSADKFKVPGWYRCSTNAIAASLANCPIPTAFTMEVLPNLPATQRLTEHVALNHPRIYIRNYYAFQSRWGVWAELTTTKHRLEAPIDLIGQETYTFHFDGYLVLRAHYSAGSYVNCTLMGSNASNGILLTATSGASGNLKGNPTTVVYVRQAMIIKDITTNNTSNNDLEFYPLY